MTRRRVGVLISGRGSNMAALAAAAAAPDYPAEIAVVLSNEPDAPGLAIAAAYGIAAEAVPHRGRSGGKPAFEAALDAALRTHGVELICLAGFMRVLSADFLSEWRDAVLNIHPSLLPAFPGLDTHARAIASGACWHGATVHLVTPALDAGPIVAQAILPLRADDTPESLSARLLPLEHRLYPAALGRIARDGWRVVGNRVVFAPPAGALSFVEGAAAIED